MNTDDQIKLAQAQLIQHTAEQMGVDVNELSSEELAKFASYVLSEVGENEEQAKVAEADALGRFMARSFVEEQEKIAAAQQVQGTVASAMEDIAGAWSEKVAARGKGKAKRERAAARAAASVPSSVTPEVIPSSVIPDAVLPEAPPATPAATPAELSRLQKMRAAISDFYTGDFTRAKDLQGMDKAKAYGMGTAKALGTLGAAGALGYGAYRAMGGGEEEAKVAYLLKLAADATDTAAAVVGEAVGSAPPSSPAAKIEEIGRLRRALNSARDFYTRDFTTGAAAEGFGPKAKAYGMGAAKALGTVGAAGALGYGAYRGLGYGGEEEAKVAHFLKLAEEMEGTYKRLPRQSGLEELAARRAAASPAAVAEEGMLRRALNSARDFYTSDFTRGAGLSGMDKAKAYGMGGAKALGTLGAAGALGYGAYRGLGYGGDEEAKVAGYEFAKLAEARAAEIMAANGIHPETFEAIEPVAVKIAQVSTPDDFYTYEEKVASYQFNQELNEAASHILNSLGLV